MLLMQVPHVRTTHFSSPQLRAKELGFNVASEILQSFTQSPIAI